MDRPATPDLEPDEDMPLLPEIEVDPGAPVDTGLLDARGNKIFRTPRPIGFGRGDRFK